MNGFTEELRRVVSEGVQRVAVAQQQARASEAERLARNEAAIQRYEECVALADALSGAVFLPLLHEFQAILEEGGVLCDGKVDRHRVPRGAFVCTYLATGMADKSRRYYIGVSALPYCDGPLELSVECHHDNTRACRTRIPKFPLVDFLAKRVSAAGTDHESARQWCEGVLKGCAAAVMEANFFAGRAAARMLPVTGNAPLVMPGDDECGVTV